MGHCMDVKQIVAGGLNVGYIDAGPEDGTPVLLLHGWPYDIHSYVDVAPPLTARGYRVIIPYLRRYGTTHFLSEETFRNGEQVVLALDVIALMDALEIESPILAGFDWGARTADVVAALWPERCKGLVAVSGYLIGSQDAGKLPLPPAAELQWWYQYYFATDAAGLATTYTGVTLRSSSGGPPRRSGTSTTPPLIAARRRSRTPTTSTSSSTTTAGVWG
jgi:pimeloyl-ACP methyl ester carboxylesterase